MEVPVGGGEGACPFGRRTSSRAAYLFNRSVNDAEQRCRVAAKTRRIGSTTRGRRRDGREEMGGELRAPVQRGSMDAEPRAVPRGGGETPSQASRAATLALVRRRGSIRGGGGDWWRRGEEKAKTRRCASWRPAADSSPTFAPPRRFRPSRGDSPRRWITARPRTSSRRRSPRSPVASGRCCWRAGRSGRDPVRANTAAALTPPCRGSTRTTRQNLARFVCTRPWC